MAQPSPTPPGKPAYPPPPQPRRIVLSRKKGWKMPANTMKVDRSTEFGNPFELGNVHPILGKLETIDQVVEAYRLYLEDWIQGRSRRNPAALNRLKGHDLACWCPLDQPCHADVLLARLNPKPERKAQP